MEPARAAEHAARRTQAVSEPSVAGQSAGTGAATRARGPAGTLLLIALVLAVGWMLLVQMTRLVGTFDTGASASVPAPAVESVVEPGGTGDVGAS